MSVPALEEAFEKVSKLAATFRANEARYLSPDYQEAEARKDFIDKFFIALGWDVNHDQQTNPYEQEVKVEPAVSAAGQRRADYAFHLAPNYRDVRFYVEAKKPHGDIATADNYFQTIRYGWNSETPLAALTDFEQFHVLDCRDKPDIGTALYRHVAKYHYSEFIDRKKFAEIYWLFSREAVADGSLEKRAKELPKPRGKARQLAGLFPGGYQSIDESFLKQLDEYRTSLAHTFKNKNPKLDSETLTELAQRTLDRLIFLRFLEDKGIEPQRLVDKFGDKGTAWEDFIAASRRLDDIYNGIVFKHHDILDGDKFRVDDTAFADICESLAHVNSPYDFNAIPIHILGSIYERFLGNVIVATDKRVRVEPKPEVRKAGGVYYTPEYIVRYIVENTVGKLIAGKTPDQIAEMRFADIACGSGSFLLGVFDLLLTYHGHYYNDNPNRARKGDCINHGGKLYLSLRKKREILLNNIFGVDIEAQPVEVCQLSLYLKLLQEETEASTHQYMLDFTHIAQMKKLLPDLSKNIICGNSLIGRDIKCDLFGEERKLNPMNFEDAFPEVMKRGGFDAVVGNPPWGGLFSETELEYHRHKNKEVIIRMIDSFMYFLYQGSKKVNPTGYLAMILPDVVLYQTDNEALRRYLLRTFSLRAILNMGDVFHKVTRPACILIMKRGERTADSVRVADFTHLPKDSKPEALRSGSGFVQLRQVELSKIPGAAFITETPARYSIWERLQSVPHKRLAELVDEDGIQRGVSPDLKEAFIVSSKTVSKWRLEKERLRKVLTGGRQVKRYHIERPDLWLIYMTRETDIRALPKIRAYIDQFEKQITCKEVKQKKHSMYVLHRARDERIFKKPRKFLGVITEDEIIIAPDETGAFASDGLYLFGVSEGADGNYLMAILNSRLFVFIYRLLAIESGRVLAQVKPTTLQQLPIRTLNLADPSEESLHDEIVTKVDAMLEAKKQLAEAKTDKDKTYYENKVAALDRQIDRLVYDLYGLTEKEIQIVEQQK
jgi:type I restriction-modification system DNA methylase subunit